MIITIDYYYYVWLHTKNTVKNSEINYDQPKEKNMFLNFDE